MSIVSIINSVKHPAALFSVTVKRGTYWHFMCVLWCVQALIGCATPQDRASELAQSAGFSRAVAAGHPFDHVVYQNGPHPRPVADLHVYIEGDGTPWIGGRYPAVDPTPRNPLALEMMARDTAPAIYLGRPCYFGLATSSHCRVETWTSQRYSQDVVQSMVAVINNYQQAYQAARIILIGYSGGGTLAALIAAHLQEPVFLLTIAANLDTDLWTRSSGFLPLQGSLNPIDFRSGIAHVPQLHLAGLEDATVPLAVTESYTAGADSKNLRVYPDFDHQCCWLKLWPEILAERPWAVTPGETTLPLQGASQVVPVIDQLRPFSQRIITE